MREEKREVYIGNGITISVKPNNEVMYLLDTNKLNEIFEREPERELTVGAKDDWYWTAQTIKGKSEFDETKNEYSLLRASCWSRFCIDQEEDCTIEVPINFYQLVRHQSFLDGMYKVDQWLFNLYKDGISKMKYETIKEMQEELEPIIRKYLDTLTTHNKQ